MRACLEFDATEIGTKETMVRGALNTVLRAQTKTATISTLYSGW